MKIGHVTFFHGSPHERVLSVRVGSKARLGRACGAISLRVKTVRARNPPSFVKGAGWHESGS